MRFEKQYAILISDFFWGALGHSKTKLISIYVFGSGVLQFFWNIFSAITHARTCKATFSFAF